MCMQACKYHRGLCKNQKIVIKVRGKKILFKDLFFFYISPSQCIYNKFYTIEILNDIQCVVLGALCTVDISLSSSVVEHLTKVAGVQGSIPGSRSSHIFSYVHSSSPTTYVYYTQCSCVYIMYHTNKTKVIVCIYTKV